MKKLGNLLIVTSCFLLLGIVTALSYPHAFTGAVTYGTNLVVPDGYVITAGIDGVITGSSTVKSGSYDLVVEGNSQGSDIEFFLNGEKMNEEANFFNFEIEVLDLSIDDLPALNQNFCGDNVCSSNECSFCSVDCSFNDCLGNGACDIDIGEDCSNSPSDCGLCLGNSVCDEKYGETCETAPQDCGECEVNVKKKKSSGGGGGGSSNGAIVTPAAFDVEKDEEEAESPIESISDLNEGETRKDTDKITGAAVAVLDDDSVMGWAVIVILVIAAVWIYLRSKKNAKRDTVTPVTRSYMKKRVKKRVSKKKVTRKKAVRKKVGRKK